MSEKDDDIILCTCKKCRKKYTLYKFGSYCGNVDYCQQCNAKIDAKKINEKQKAGLQREAL